MKHLNLGVIVVFLILFTSSPCTSQKSYIDSDYSLRPLFELDRLSKGEAYPWISNDGLRIYYTAYDDISEVFCIWFSERKSVDDAFEAHRRLSINSTQVDNISSWLSADENTLAFVQRTQGQKMHTKIVVSYRNEHSGLFETCRNIQVQGGIKGTLISPSFTSDMQQMIVFNEYKGHSYLLIFDQTDDHIYELHSELKFPDRFRVKTGKLSNDGLEYYISLQEGRRKPSVFIMKRESLQDRFGEFQKFDDALINDRNHRNHQVHFAAEKQLIVFTRSDQNEWNSNGIFIARHKDFRPGIKIETDFLENILDDVIVYPNPAIDYISFKNTLTRDLDAQIFDASGALVRYLENIEAEEAIPINDFTPGTYYIKLRDKQLGDYRIFKHIKL